MTPFGEVAQRVVGEQAPVAQREQRSTLSLPVSPFLMVVGLITVDTDEPSRSLRSLSGFQ